MRLTQSPEALPGSCFIAACGSASRANYIDTGMSMEFHGAVYICDQCLAEMARLLGFSTQMDTFELRNRIDQLERQNYEYRRQLDGLEMVVNGFTLSRGTGGVDSVPDVDLAPSEPDEGVSEPDEEVGTGEGAPPESVHDERVAKLSDDDTAFSFNL